MNQEPGSWNLTGARRIIDMMNGKEIPLALSPCLKAACDGWRDGECIHIRKAGKIIALKWVFTFQSVLSQNQFQNYIIKKNSIKHPHYFIKNNH
jgi:hypothetical protein